MADRSAPALIAASMTEARIAAVVINHNTRGHLHECLSAILADEPAQTIVVDTGSRDSSAELVRKEFPIVELVETENRGYAAGANAGLQRIRLPYAFLLNADTRPAPGALPALERYLDRHPRAAAVGPLIADKQGRPEVTGRRFPTPVEVLLQESGLHRLLRPARADKGPRTVDWVLGAAFALRCDAVSDVGGFDESYFMYNEEVDLCLRLRQARWEVHYAPIATVTHVGGASTSLHRAAMVEQYVRSTAALYRRHFLPRQQAQLRVILETALTARSIRERARLLLTLDPARRRALHAELKTWQAARAALRGA
jgi:N-acetylglucosaminyl-diphospho-decaprenol L-rhamnosyltransferase